MLHYILTYVIIPKAKNFSQLTGFELHILYAIKNDIALKWAYIMKTHMFSSRVKTTRLSYAREINKLIGNLSNDIRNETRFDMNTYENLIDYGVICKMGMFWDEHKKMSIYRNEVRPSTSSVVPL